MRDRVPGSRIRGRRSTKRAQPPVALTIAGSDSAGGAGIQADLKTFAALGVFGTSVVTALTAQNTLGVRAIRPVDAPFVAAQLDAVLADLPVRAVKTGMLASAETVAMVGAFAGRLPNLVVDPVLVSSSGHRLFTGEAQRAYLDVLFPCAAVVTPNLREAGVLLDRTVSTVDDMVAAAVALAATGARCVVVKGGHLLPDAGPVSEADAPPEDPSRVGSAVKDPKPAAGGTGRQAVDVVWHDGRIELLRAPWIDTSNNHGTGCTFAAATAARLARGDPLPVALRAAKSYVHRAIAGAAHWRLGAGHGPLSWEVPS